MTLRIHVAQLNPRVGDFAGNVEAIIRAARHAHADGAHLMLTPEMSICGYPAQDLWQRPAFQKACDEAVEAVASALSDLKGFSVVVGHPSGNDSLRNGQVLACSMKLLKPLMQTVLPHWKGILGQG